MKKKRKHPAKFQLNVFFLNKKWKSIIENLINLKTYISRKEYEITNKLQGYRRKSKHLWKILFGQKKFIKKSIFKN